LVRIMTVTKRLRGLPIERTLGVISGRWKPVILHVLLNGPRRTCELEKHIPSITQKVLIQQLRSLEEHGIVSRQTYADEPQRVDYTLTPLGISLKPLIAMLDEWGRHHAEELDETDKLLACEAVVRDTISKGK
jgi:DNA-binding HxlR family transcriptional regulator